MIRILSITLRNFLSIGNITQAVNLSMHGLTLVLGENADIGGANSRNGVGKTSLLQGISYGLFGEPLTKIKLDNLVNNINNKGMLVTIELEANGKKYRIERGRKPNVLRLFEDGIDLNEARGENKITQAEIDRLVGMTHTMFTHIVALNTFTDPFMKMKAADQREVIEELLGITQLSQRAAALKDQMDDTKDALKAAEATIKATNEANARIEQAIERARGEAELWQRSHDRQLAELMGRAERLNEIDIDAEIGLFDQLDAWTAQRKEIEGFTVSARQQSESLTQEISRLKREIARYEDEATRIDNGEIARLEAQMQRYLNEAEADISPQIKRLEAEANRRRQEAERKLSHAQTLATDLEALQAQLDNPDAHTCSTCGQGLAGTDHLASVMARLEQQLVKLSTEIEKAMIEADSCQNEATAIEAEIIQTKETHEAKKNEAQTKAIAIRQDIVVAREARQLQQQQAADRVVELQSMVEKLEENKQEQQMVITEASTALEAIGDTPRPNYPSRDAVWKIRQERDILLNQIEAEIAKPNPNDSKIEGLQSTLTVVDYEPVNEINLTLKHEAFLYKLLTAKDSFVRKKIVDQNLLYLNNRMNHYLEKLELPHEVRFMPDLTVEITLLGRELDFEQLSRGEMNRVILATWWAFRDVWESLNQTFNLLFVDECLDFGMDGSGAEAALMTLQSMARDRHKNVFLISHKENLIGRADRVMLVRKENQFTTFDDDYQLG